MSAAVVLQPLLGVVALGCAIAALVWGRSSRRLYRMYRRLQRDGGEGEGRDESLALVHASYVKDTHTALLYLCLVVVAGAEAAWGGQLYTAPLLLLAVGVVATLRSGRWFQDSARLAQSRALLERRAEEVLAQQELAPVRWSARLAPAALPDMEGFQVGQAYQPGTGAMAGDFYDVSSIVPTRWAAAIGDVTGHGIEASITAFQVKYLLRVLLRRYRDPAQAVEELNAVMSAQNQGEELVSLCAVVFDQLAGTLRYASAGHPPAWLWHDGEVRPLRATGPLLALDPKGTYFSREVALIAGDVLLLYTDGLAEARSGEALFGEGRIAQVVRRESAGDLTALCKSLLGAAQEFASEPLNDDVAILAIRRT
ncbi:MAG TPA: PP2C family protein-serine/threonine phosphatase [Acidimicrobiales bacterium]|jgi:serine phosphatase RsbU (regulator of sigma subunit)|nr:PP2C family protein-serine/threonine phosphatase [Acidimicrobiales bacterium]